MQYYERPENRAPAGSVCSSVLARDGVELRVVVCAPAHASGTVILFGGRADFVERYFETMRDITRRGLACVAFDWRGQGGSQRLTSDRKRGHVRRFSDYLLDIDAVLEQAALSGCPQPYYAIAHSTGGLVLMHYLRNNGMIEKAVITSPLVGFRYGAWPKSVAHMLAAIAHYTGLGWMYLPGYKKGPLQNRIFDNNPLTTDRKRWERDIETLDDNPQLGIAGPTFSWFKGAVDFIHDLQSWSHRDMVTCPVLFVCAEQERVVDPRAARFLSDQVAGISYLEIEDARHEILMEKTTIRQQFWSAFESFVG